MARAICVCLFAFASIVLIAATRESALAIDKRIHAARQGGASAASHIRAGCPLNVSDCAHPTNTPAYQGGYVGGGAAFHGDPPTLEEGTWGRDYVGWRFLRLVFIGWSHGRRYQGGDGAYKTDGPHLIKHK